MKPRGQVLLGHNDNWMDVMLKDQERIVIPNKTVLVQVHGEVMFPNAMVFDEGSVIDDYVKCFRWLLIKSRPVSCTDFAPGRNHLPH